MSLNITVQEVISDAAARWGDPSLSRLTESVWLGIYNNTLELMTRRYKILEQDATFDITADESRYTWPDDMVQVKRLRNTPTPTDNTTYREIGEVFEDEFRAATGWTLPEGDDYFHYFARGGFFELTPRPTTQVVAGGLITYWKLAARVSTVNALFELPTMARALVVTRMVIDADQRSRRDQAVNNALAIWEHEVSLMFEKMEDRSADRRPQLRPAQRSPFSYMT